MSKIAPLKNPTTSEGKVVAPSKKVIDWEEERERYIARRDLDRIIWLHLGRMVSQENYDYRLDIIVKAMAEDTL